MPSHVFSAVRYNVPVRYAVQFAVFVALMAVVLFIIETSRQADPASTPTQPTTSPPEPTGSADTPGSAEANSTTSTATSTASSTADTDIVLESPSSEPVTKPINQAPSPTAPEPTTTKPVITDTVSNASPTPQPEPATPPTPPEKISWGVFTGSNKAALDDFERRVEANPDYLAWFVHWGNHGGELPDFVKNYAYEKDRTLVLFWEASDYVVGGTDQPAYSYRRILDGAWDDYIQDFKQQLIDYEGPVILVPFSELNGDWTPWSGTENGNTPEQAVEAFRYLYERMADAPNISFGWAVNRMSVPNTYENRIERYYPGDDYVDYIGVDGFNKGNPWLTFEDIFAEPLTTLAQYNKPTFVFSFGSAPGPEKAAWLDEAFNTVLPQYSHVVGWVYFNQNKERNWLLWSDPASFAVFEDYISD